MKWLNAIILLFGYSSAYQIRSISIYGLETENRRFVCQDVNPVSYYIQKVKDMGFNNLRLPFSLQYVDEGDYSKLDDAIGFAESLNMSVILDCHRVESSWQGPHPFYTGLTMEAFIDKWLVLLKRYYNSSNVVAMNAYNEYQGDDVAFCNDYHRRLFDKVEEIYPNRYNYYMTGTKWASDLRGITLEDRPYKDRVGYSVHKYSWSGTHNREDYDATIPYSIPSHKIIIGEFGWMEDKPEQVAWAIDFLRYLQERDIMNTSFWTISHSFDTGNMWYNDCFNIKWDTLNVLIRFWNKKLRRYLRR